MAFKRDGDDVGLLNKLRVKSTFPTPKKYIT